MASISTCFTIAAKPRTYIPPSSRRWLIVNQNSQFHSLRSQGSLPFQNHAPSCKLVRRSRSVYGSGFRVQASFDAAVSAIRPGRAVESDKLSADVRKRAMDAVETCGGRVTVGDVPSKSGLKVNEAQKALQALSADTDGFLEMAAIPAPVPEDSPLHQTFQASCEDDDDYCIRVINKCNDWSFSAPQKTHFRNTLVIAHCILSGLPNIPPWLEEKSTFDSLIIEDGKGGVIPNEEWRCDGEYIFTLTELRLRLMKAEECHTRGEAPLMKDGGQKGGDGGMVGTDSDTGMAPLFPSDEEI